MNASSGSDRSQRSIRPLMLILGVLISAIGVWLIAYVIDPNKLIRALRSAQYDWILIALVAVCLTFFTRIRRWAILLRPLVFRDTLLLMAQLSGQIVNFLAPIRLGDLVRAILVSRQSETSFARVLGSIIIEKAWDWLTLCLIIVIAAVVVPLPTWFMIPARTVGFIAMLILIGFASAAVIPATWLIRGLMRIDRSFAWLPVRWRAAIVNNLHRLLDSLTALRHREAIAGAAWWSIVTWALGIATNYAVLRAFGIDSWIAATVLLIVIMVGIALPPSIAAIGVLEGLTMLTLSAFDVPLEIALAIGITLHFVIFMPPLVADGLLFAHNIRRSKQQRGGMNLS